MTHLHISATCHFCEVLLLLQSFVHFIISHTETAQSSLNRVMCFGKDYKFGHVRYTDDLTIHLSGKVHRLLHLPAVYKPESDEENTGDISAYFN